MRDFYRVFIRTRYLKNYTAADLNRLAYFVISSDIDFSNVTFFDEIQMNELGRLLSAREKEIDSKILSGSFFAFNAISFVESELNPRDKSMPSSKWPRLSSSDKALLLKYMVAIKEVRGSSLELLKLLVDKGLDLEQIPERFYLCNTPELIDFIKAYEPGYETGVQLEASEILIGGSNA